MKIRATVMIRTMPPPTPTPMVMLKVFGLADGMLTGGLGGRLGGDNVVLWPVAVTSTIPYRETKDGLKSPRLSNWSRAMKASEATIATV